MSHLSGGKQIAAEPIQGSNIHHMTFDWCDVKYAFVIVIEAELQTDIDSADDEIASSRGNYLKISINDDACSEDSIINSMKSVNEQGFRAFQNSKKITKNI